MVRRPARTEAEGAPSVEPRPPDGPWWRRIPPRTLRVVAASGGGALLVLVVALLAFGPVVRSRVAKEAARRKVDVSVGAVRPGFFAVTLKDVKVKPEGVDGVSARLDEVRITLTAGLSVREVSAKGGSIDVGGDPEDVIERMKSFRKSGGGGPSSGGAASNVPVGVEGLALAWKLPSGGELTAAGLALSRTEVGEMRVSCTRFVASHGPSSLEVTGGTIETDRDAGLRRVAAATLTLAHEPAAAPKPTAPKNAAPDEPPPLPVAPKGSRAAKAKVAGKAAPPPPQGPDPAADEPVLPLPDLHALRARIGAVAASVGARVPDGSKIDIGGLAVKLGVGGETVAFGPAPFALERRGDVIRLSFTSEKAEGGAQAGTPISIDAELPLGAGDVTARLSGGPVSLALLGVKEGTKGLFDVGRGTVSGKGQLVLAAAGDSLTFDGRIALKSISIKQPRLAPEPLRGLELSVGARGVLDDVGRLRIDDAQLDMGALHVKTHGTLEETREHFAASLSLDVAPAACQSLLESAPRGLLPTIQNARMSGTFGATGQIAFDSRAIDKLVLEYTIDDRCKMVEVPRELSRERFAESFTYRTYAPDGTPTETTTGPGTPNWTNLEDISPFMVAAVLTTEDGAFYKHHGFNHAAIKNSLAANIKARRFVRGASTITMQLAKNLFLSRDKTLSRKIEEVVLTDYLEQVFRKDDMMELYLNVIEFGPDVYGVTQAAEHYFGRRPDELNLPECFFLASLLPSPIRYGKLRDKGEVSEGWMKHLRALMEISAKNGKITQAELAEGIGQPIVFHKDGDPKPEPRKSAPRPRRDPNGDDAAWQPLN
jgi:hypothetical protein